jgi:hypothetical protein
VQLIQHHVRNETSRFIIFGRNIQLVLVKQDHLQEGFLSRMEMTAVINQFCIMLRFVMTTLIRTELTLKTADTVSVITNAFTENHYVFRPYRSSSSSSLSKVNKGSVTELFYYPF